MWWIISPPRDGKADNGHRWWNRSTCNRSIWETRETITWMTQSVMNWNTVTNRNCHWNGFWLICCRKLTEWNTSCSNPMNREMLYGSLDVELQGMEGPLITLRDVIKMGMEMGQGACTRWRRQCAGSASPEIKDKRSQSQMFVQHKIREHSWVIF